MTEFEKMVRLSTMVEETDNSILSTYLDIAGERVCRQAYPFNPEITTVPDRYVGVQLEIAAYLISRRGAEGETAHNENGINRSWASASIPRSMLSTVIPRVGVPK